MSYFQKHVFICTNQRDADKKCCNQEGASILCQYAKTKIKELKLGENQQVRVNIAGCLGRCAEGPVLVIYPEAVWYTYSSQKDIDQIIEEHLLKNKIVQRLLLSL